MAEATDMDPIVASVRQRLGEIQAKLLVQDPNLPVHLSAIHTTLLQYEELAHLLSEDEIAVLIKGMEKHSGTELVAAAISKKSGPKSVPKGKTISDDL